MQHLRVVTSLVFLCMPLTADIRTEAQSLVKRSIDLYKGQGRESMVLEVGRPGGKLRNGMLYVFVYDLQGVVVAHGQLPRLIGTNLYNSKDPKGKLFVQERIALAKEKGSGWQDYVFMNPATKRWEPKTAYIELHDGLIFGCGVYR